MYKREALLFEHIYSFLEKSKTFLLLLDLIQLLTKLKIYLKKYYLYPQTLFITAMKTGDVAVNDVMDLYSLRSLFCQCLPGILMTNALKEQSIVLH